MEFYHDSQQKSCRSPAGAVSAGTCVSLSLLVIDPEPHLCCKLHLIREKISEEDLPMTASPVSEREVCFSVKTVICHQPALCWYYFSITKDDGGRLYYGNNSQRLGGPGQIYGSLPPAFQITVYRPSAVPGWYRNTIAYQIFPDRFSRDPNWQARQAAAGEALSRNRPCRLIQQDWSDIPFYTRDQKGRITRWPFFGGSLSGIRSRLLYLKSLGVGAVYLNPIFKAASNHKYDTADYLQIDPAFGTEEDFSLLAKDARRLGIRLILDGVFNHTGADSLYFNRFGSFPSEGACQGPDSPWYRWYSFTDFPDEYSCWWGVTDLPAVNKNDPSYRNFICGSVVPHWLKAGGSGWRLDVADELPDDFISSIRQAIRRTDPEGLLLGEVWEDASNKISYGRRRRYLLGDGLDAVMNYPLRNLLIDYFLGKSSARDAVQQLRSLAENYPPESFYSCFNLIGSHDRPRILTLLGDAPEDLPNSEKEHYRLPKDKYDLACRRLKLLSLLQFCLPGVPAIYYGDEAGCQGLEDPFNRGTYPWGKEDPDLLDHYRQLASLRKQYSLLTEGGYRFSWEGDHVLLCRRWSADKSRQLLILINRHLFGGVSFDLELDPEISWVLELSSSSRLFPKDGKVPIDLSPLSALVLDCRQTPPPQPGLLRAAGVLCHVSSLPSGKMDGFGEQFIDYLADCGQKLWQILPLNPPDPKSSSPYSSPAVFAGDPSLCPVGRQMDNGAYEAFCRDEAYWLDDFALYMVLRESFDGLPWQKWPAPQRDRKDLDPWKKTARKQLEKIKKSQFSFWSRWMELKNYANKKGISVIGDLPLYPAVDSADTWAHRDLFLLDEDGIPLAGAGVPPDAFSHEGQNWGNPLYDWEALKKDGYFWWKQRISRAMKRFDYVRMDHFRSFSAFYTIARGKTTMEGFWLPGPGEEFFQSLAEDLGPLPLLAEDLGLLDIQTKNLLRLCGFPGMLVYQFSSEEMLKLSEEAAASKIFYTGTHDNQTLTGWCKERSTQNTCPDAIIESLYHSNGAWVIAPLQDLLGLGDECRMNVPGRAMGNWAWRFSSSQLSSDLARQINKLASESGR